MEHSNFPNGIVGVIQTPFDPHESIDWESLERLIEDAIDSGVDGFLAPAVASEVGKLSTKERIEIIRFVAATVNQRVPIIAGASSETIEECKAYAILAKELNCCAYLLSVPEAFYRTPSYFLPYLQMITPITNLPLVVQDLHWQSYGMPVETLAEIQQNVPAFQGIKIETVPAGPKYTHIRQTFGKDFYICGGWAVPQMIEALDRGVNALMPECSMIRVYKTIWNLYQSGKRSDAQDLFRRLLPILSFTNQEIYTSIAFFKKLLVKRGIFKHDTMRGHSFVWDEYNARIADELIERFLELENWYRMGKGV